MLCIEAFIRDVSFYLMGIITVAIVAASKSIYIGTAITMFALYGWYVAVVFLLSWLENKRAREAATSKQGKVRHIRKIRDDNIKGSASIKTFGSDLQQAYWYKVDDATSSKLQYDADDGTKNQAKAPSTYEMRSDRPDITGVGKTGYTFSNVDEAEAEQGKDLEDKSGGAYRARGTRVKRKTGKVTMMLS